MHSVRFYLHANVPYITIEYSALHTLLFGCSSRQCCCCCSCCRPFVVKSYFQWNSFRWHFHFFRFVVSALHRLYNICCFFLSSLRCTFFCVSGKVFLLLLLFLLNGKVGLFISRTVDDDMYDMHYTNSFCRSAIEEIPENNTTNKQQQQQQKGIQTAYGYNASTRF